MIWLWFYPIVVEKDSWKIADPEGCFTQMRKLPPGNYTITIIKWHKRTLKQNRMYWAIINWLAETSWEDAQDIHDWFKDMFLSKKLESEIFWEKNVVRSTTELTTKEFTDYVEKVANFAASWWVVVTQ